MAIEFNCPYCTSAIRVPDNAAGKKGTCPRCETPIVVPVVEVPATTRTPSEQPQVAPPSEPPAPIPPPPEIPVATPDGEPVFPGPPTAGDGEFTAIEQPLVTPAEPVPSYARALKRKKKRGIGVVVPLVFGVLLIAAFIYFWLQNRPTLYGELTAERLTEFESASGGIARAEAGDLPKEDIGYVLEDLQENPKRLTSSLMETEFRGTAAGIEVHVFAGQQSAFFRVAPRKNKDFDDWVGKNADALEKPHLKEFKAAARRFFVAYKESAGDVPDLAGYRDPLGLNALVSRVGYNMVAIVDGTAYPCVYEDAEHRLYFLLPPKTKQFELMGRQLDNGKKVFPGGYQVKVK